MINPVNNGKLDDDFYRLRMTFQIIYNDVLKIIECKVQDEFTWDSIGSMIPGIGQFIKEKNCRAVLVDFRNSGFSFSTVNIYEVPKKIESICEKNQINAHLIKRAMLVSTQEKNAQFFETVSVNRMQNLKIFLDENEAIQWLVSKE